MLFPNILNDEVGIYKSFSPLIGFFKREDSKDDVISRIIIAFILIITIIICYIFSDYISVLSSSILNTVINIKNWGFNKLNEYHNSSTSNSISYKNKYNEYIGRMDDI